MLLDHGKIISQGDVDTVSAVYEEMTKGEKESRAKAMKEEKEMLKKVVAEKPKAENKENAAEQATAE